MDNNEQLVEWIRECIRHVWAINQGRRDECNPNDIRFAIEDFIGAPLAWMTIENFVKARAPKATSQEIQDAFESMVVQRYDCPEQTIRGRISFRLCRIDDATLALIRFGKFPLNGIMVMLPSDDEQQIQMELDRRMKVPEGEDYPPIDRAEADEDDVAGMLEKYILDAIDSEQDIFIHDLCEWIEQGSVGMEEGWSLPIVMSLLDDWTEPLAHFNTMNWLKGCYLIGWLNLPDSESKYLFSIGDDGYLLAWSDVDSTDESQFTEKMNRYLAYAFFKDGYPKEDIVIEGQLWKRDMFSPEMNDVAMSMNDD